MEAEHASLVLAEMLGAHALAYFVAALCIVLFVVGIIWHLARRVLRSSAFDAEPSPGRVILRAAAGFAVIVGAAFAFAEVAEEIGDGEEMAHFDEVLAQAIGRNVDLAALQMFARLTRLGDPLTLTLLCLIVAGVLVARGRRGLAFGWVVALAGNGILNQTLKQVFERVRPLHEHGLVQALGWSFPSGHSSGSVVAYGMLAYVLIRTLPARWHLPIVLLAAALAFTVGSSRVFLQVHFASDVAAGFLSGSAWLAVCITSTELARRYRRAGGRILP
jgi:undecaprenyl-diphosphatase